jgi:hypothetical protein
MIIAPGVIMDIIGPTGVIVVIAGLTGKDANRFH